jgi:hypothetical protein
VKDANGQQIAYLYFEDEPQRQMSMNWLTRDEAFLIAVNIAELPSVPWQILKDIRGRRIRSAGTIECEPPRTTMAGRPRRTGGSIAPCDNS